MKDLRGRAEEAKGLAEFLEHYGWIIQVYQLGCDISDEDGRITLTVRAVYDPEMETDII